MISETTLDLAVQERILSAAQAKELRELEFGRAASRFEPQDPEKLRFISGFGDIFVTIGLVLFLGALAHFAYAWGGAPGRGLLVAGASWLLAEYFTLRRRMALPSIVLLIAFAGAVFHLAASLISGDPLFPVGARAMAAAAFAMAAAAALHYWRFRVPITIAAGAGALVIIVFSAVLAAGPTTAFLLDPALFLCGIAIFAAAMWFDLRDPARLTRRTDIAFWLHLLAAPLIVHPLVEGIRTGVQPTAPDAVAILAVFVGLGVVAVLVNRRAILVSGLSYAGFAFLALVQGVGVTDTAVPITLLALGAFVLLLSAGWTRMRKALLSVTPLRLRTALPPDLDGAA